jgi:protein O-mannosyl-transferase
MLPVMLLVTEVWLFTPDLPRSVWKRLRAASWVVWGVLFLGTPIFILFSVKVFQDLGIGYATRHFTMLERLFTEARVVIWYVSLLLWPAPSRLSLEHDVVVSSSLLNPPTTFGAVVLLALLGWLLLRYRRESPLITYGGMWFFLNLLIESTIVPLELVFEHRLYLPSVGFSLVAVCALVGGLSYLLANRPKKDLAILGSCGFVLLFSILTLLTFFRNEAWRDRVTIYQDAVQKAPNHPRSHANLAVAYAQAGLHEQAILEADHASELGREYLESHVVAANATLGSLMRLERYEEAIKRAEDFLNNPPEHSNTGALTDFLLNLAQAHLVQEELSEAYAAAIKAFEYAPQKGNSTYQTRLVQGVLAAILEASADKQVDLNQDGVNDPGDSSIKTWLAKDFLERGESEQAKYLLSLASRENPEDMEAVRLLEGMKRDDEFNTAQIIKENMKKEYQSSPFSRFNASMALAYLARTPNRSASLRDMGEKLLDYALDMQPGVADAHLLKAYYLHDRKEIEPAVEATLRALTLDPDYAKAWLALGYFRMEANEFLEALSAFQKGLDLYPGCPQRQSVLAVISAIKQHPALSTARNSKQF